MAQIETTDINLPEIYAYETPGVEYHKGWIKIGDTQGEFEKRIKQQINTSGIIANKYLLGFAIYEDGSRKIFRDHAFHQFLLDKGINNKHPNWPGDEWFEISIEKAKQLFNEFRQNPPLKHKISQIILRDEQEQAISQTVDYQQTHVNGEYLWNAKPRFGKTISAMEFCKRINAQNVLVLTNKPAVANSWYEDYVEYLGTSSGYIFVSSTPDLKGKKYVLSREDYLKTLNNGNSNLKCFEFVSLQDLKGSIYYGGQYDKLGELQNITWDALFLDEAHEATDTMKSEFALDKIKRKFTLHLSGTPFKQIRNQKFDTDAIFNWTYVDEQRKKNEWVGIGENPYEELPKLHMHTYRMVNLVDGAKQVDLNDDEFEYAYKLSQFFATNTNDEFIHKTEVLKFLNALVEDNKFPLSSKTNRDALAHTFWLMPSRSACKAMERELKNHKIFKEYEILNVAVDNFKGLKSSSDEYDKENVAYSIVKTAIANHDKTITLAVQRLTTGVTIPEWTAVFILSEMKSEQTYMQAAFRAQNPCVFEKNGKFYRKTNSYVFDFNPERSLTIIEKFANDLYSNTANGKGTYNDRKTNITELLKYLPVTGEDENGNFHSLTAEEVLSIPRTIRCNEVVRRGFMCNFLFANDFSGIFRAPNVVTKILNQISIPKDSKGKIKNPIDISTTIEDLHLNENGEVEISKEDAIKNANENIATKQEIEEIAKNTCVNLSVFTHIETDKEKEDKMQREEIKKTSNNISTEFINKVKTNNAISKATENKIKSTTFNNVEKAITTTINDRNIELQKIEKEYRELFLDCLNTEVEQCIEEEKEKINKKYQEIQNEKILNVTEELRIECSKIIMTEKCEKEKYTKENEIREHLKGFARTIPSFLMAYGNENTTLETFEKNIPKDVFKDVTSITIEEFVFLRDGGDMKDDDGNIVHFDGHVFEPTVFNDSVKAFLKKKKELSNYFEQSQKEDIFDYIPPQKTNQIYTPKNVVKHMVDLLEENNPGCFDDDTNTFIDLYMKSGLYITEIVKRLYQSKKMKELYTDDKERLKHIFKEQVYGLAPTEIIYNIAKNYILGFDENIDIKEHNLRLCDAQKYIEEGILNEKLEELFGN